MSAFNNRAVEIGIDINTIGTARVTESERAIRSLLKTLAEAQRLAGNVSGAGRTLEAGQAASSTFKGQLDFLIQAQRLERTMAADRARVNREQQTAANAQAAAAQRAFNLDQQRLRLQAEFQYRSGNPGGAFASLDQGQAQARNAREVLQFQIQRLRYEQDIADVQRRAARAQEVSEERAYRAEQQRLRLLADYQLRSGNGGAALGTIDQATRLAQGRAARAGPAIDNPAEVLALQSQRLRVEQAIERSQGNQDGLWTRMTGGANTIFRTATKILATFFLLEYAGSRIFNGIKGVFFDPFTKLTKEVLSITEQFRKMEITFSGITGSLRASRALVQDIAQASSKLPVTTLEAVGALRQTAFVPFVAQRLQTPAGRPEFVEKLLQTLTGLATINPTQGFQGAGFAVREALAGQFRSLRFRFDISPDVVAASIDKTVKDLTKNPELTLKAIESFVKTFVGPDVLEELNNTLTGQGKRFRSTLESFFRQIGEVEVPGRGSLFQGILDTVANFNDAFAKFAGSDDGRKAASRISNALQTYVNALIDGASYIVSALSGKQVDIRAAIEDGDLKAIGDVFAGAVDGLTNLSASLIAFGSAAAAAIVPIAKFVLGPITPDEVNARVHELELRQEDQRRIYGAMKRGYATPSDQIIIERNLGPVQRTALGVGGLSVSEAANLAFRNAMSDSDTSELSRLKGVQSLFSGATRSRSSGFDSFLRSSAELAGLGGNGRDIFDSGKEAQARLSGDLLGVQRQAQTIIESTRSQASALGADVLSLAEATDELSQIIPDSLGRIASDTITAKDSLTKLSTLLDAAKIQVTKGDLDPTSMAKAVRWIEHAESVVASLAGLTSRSGSQVVNLAAQRIASAQLRTTVEAMQALSPAGVLRGAGGRVDDVIAGGNFASSSQMGESSALRILGGSSSLNILPRTSDDLNSVIGLVRSQTAAGQRLKQPRDQLLNRATSQLEALLAIYQDPKVQETLALSDVKYTDFIDSLKQAIEDAKDELDAFREYARDFAGSISDSFKGVSDVLYDVIRTGGKNIASLLTAISDSILKAITDAMTRIFFIESLLNPLLNAAFGSTLPTNNLFGLSGGAAGGLGGGIGGAGGAPSYGFPSGSVGAAHGGIFANAEGFAGGGILDRANGLMRRSPWVNTVEDGTPEAIIPLRGGGIPVRMLGNSRSGSQVIQVTIVNSVDSVSMMRQAAARDPNTIVNPVVADLRGRGQTRRSVQRVRR